MNPMATDEQPAVLRCAACGGLLSYTIEPAISKQLNRACLMVGGCRCVGKKRLSSTEQYQLGYDDGYSDGWREAVERITQEMHDE